MPNRALLAAILAVPSLLSPQPLTGSGGGTLSSRAHFVAFYSGQPPDASIQLLLLLRGQPGWETGGASGQAGFGRGSATAGRGPMRYSLAVGTVQFECVYDAERHTLTYGGRDHQLGSSNVVIIDRIDSIGGPPQITQRLTLTLPAYRGGPDGVASLRAIPELQEFLR